MGATTYQSDRNRRVLLYIHTLRRRWVMIWRLNGIFMTLVITLRIAYSSYLPLCTAYFLRTQALRVGYALSHCMLSACKFFYKVQRKKYNFWEIQIRFLFLTKTSGTKQFSYQHLLQKSTHKNYTVLSLLQHTIA